MQWGRLACRRRRTSRRRNWCSIQIPQANSTALTADIGRRTPPESQSGGQRNQGSCCAVEGHWLLKEPRMVKVILDRPRNFTRRAFLPIIASWPALASSANDDEAVWTQYLAWLNGRVLGDLVGLDTYRKVLADQGLPKEEVERRIALIHERSLKRPEAMRLYFNSMYGPHGAVGPDWPTPFLMDVVKGIEPGTALDICMGEGRNSIFLTGLGWKVTGFDVSDVAVANALAKAKKAGVEMTAVRSGYQEFNFGHERWDLIVMTYAYFPIRDATYIDRLIGSMRRGGIARISVRSAQKRCRPYWRRSDARYS